MQRRHSHRVSFNFLTFDHFSIYFVHKPKQNSGFIRNYFYCCFIITSINQSISQSFTIQFNLILFNSLIFVFDFILRKKKYCHFDYLTTIIIWTTNIFIFLGSIFLFVVIDFDLFIHIPQLVSIHIYQPYQTKKKNSFMNCLSVVIFSYIFILNFDFFIFASSFTIFHPIPIVRLSYTKKNVSLWVNSV